MHHAARSQLSTLPESKASRDLLCFEAAIEWDGIDEDTLAD